MKNIKKGAIIFILISSIVVSNIAMAATNDIIIFKDKNLQNALNEYYDWNEDFTKEKASELSQNKDCLILDSANISDLDGLQYFDNLKMVDLRRNKLSNLNILPMLANLKQIVIVQNSINGREFESILENMGNIKKLEFVYLMNNKLTDISFMKKIGSINNYTHIIMNDNKIKDISVLKNATGLVFLDLSNNRISDVTALKNLSNLTFYIDLRDNCIIDYKPIKHLLDEMHSDPGIETGLERYDYYKNPVNFKYNGKSIKFPYLTVYYKYQAYAEAVPLLKDLGGTAKYNKKTGTLTCKYNGNVLVFKDFSNKYTLNGEKKKLKYPMRRMQYDLAYVPVKDICEVLGLEYKVTKTRPIYLGNEKYDYAPKLVEISKAEKELG